MLDAQVGLEGRLAAAHEFLAAARHDAFAEAAVEDAAAHVAQARGAVLALAPTAPVDPRLRYAPLASLALLILGALFGGGAGTTAPDRPLLQPTSSPSPGRRARRHRRGRAPPRRLRPELLPSPEDTAAAAPRGEAGPLQGPGRRAVRRGQGVRRQDRARALGRSQVQELRRRLARARLRPGPALQAGRPNPPSPARSPRPRRTRRSPRTPKKKEPEPAGATTGTGASKGSGKNPTASEWTSKGPGLGARRRGDRGGRRRRGRRRGAGAPRRGPAQPARPATAGEPRPAHRLRQPPQPRRQRPRRTQPAQKSRGVASLVLGVPIPDRVKGQPGPGRTKVTQERIEPEAEDAQPRARLRARAAHPARRTRVQARARAVAARGRDLLLPRPAHERRSLSSPEPAAPFPFFFPARIMSPSPAADARASARRFKEVHDRVKAEVHKAIVGPRERRRRGPDGALRRWPRLLEGVPGIGKTMLVRSLGEALDPVVQPHPVHAGHDAGRHAWRTNVLMEHRGGRARRCASSSGPLFANLVLADEIIVRRPRPRALSSRRCRRHQVSVGDGRRRNLGQPYCVDGDPEPRRAGRYVPACPRRSSTASCSS